MKKLLCALLCLLLLLTACGKKQESESYEPTPSPTVEVTASPTIEPTPTAEPTPEPTPEPTEEAVTPAPTPTAEPIDLSSFTVMYVTGETVNVRNAPSTSGTKLTSLRRNTEVKAYKNVNGWYFIGYGDAGLGYMSANYLSTSPVIVVPAATPTVPWDTKYNTNLDINDNVFLDALEYTGYNLNKHKADGNMWRFILGTKKAGLGYLSGLEYDYGRSSGYETNADGKPDIQGFKARGGLVCASYLTYVYFNYLPNVAGIDTSHLTRPASSISAQSWRLAAEDWVKKGYSRKISFDVVRYSSGIIKFTPHEEIPVGSIVVFKVAGASDSSNARHVAIYAGRAGCGDEPVYNWLTHVGNERGPEMITIEHMGYGSTPEVPLEIITPPISFE